MLGLSGLDTEMDAYYNIRLMRRWDNYEDVIKLAIEINQYFDGVDAFLQLLRAIHSSISVAVGILHAIDNSDAVSSATGDQGQHLDY